VRAKLGKPLSGKAPYGYMWKDKKLVICPEEAPVRRLIYELFEEHQRIKTVARVLNERGYRSRIGKQWSDMAVRFQLKDPTAKGIHRRNYTRNQGAGKTWALKPESDHIFNEVEAVVSPDLWERCNKILDGRYMKRDRTAKKPTHLFSGFVFCSTCKSPMYVPTKSPKYTCQKCRNKIPCAVLEDLFLEEVKDYLIDPKNVQSFLAKAGEALTERRELLDQRQKEASKIKIDTDRMLRLYLDNSVTSDQFKQFNQPLVEQKAQIDAEVLRLQSEIDILGIDSLSGEQLVAEALDLHARWPTMSPDEKRRVAEQLVRRIEIGDGEAHLHLIQLPSYQEITNWQNTYLHASRAVRSNKESAGSASQ
jgi:site-specific DNA recombinase